MPFSGTPESGMVLSEQCGNVALIAKPGSAKMNEEQNSPTPQGAKNKYTVLVESSKVKLCHKPMYQCLVIQWCLIQLQ